MDLSIFHRWDVIALCAAMAVVFGFEMAGVFGKHYITITYIFRSILPISVRVMIWAWLGWHFIFGPQPVIK